MGEYNRAKAALADHGIEYTSKSNPMTNPGRYHGTPLLMRQRHMSIICLLQEKTKKRRSRCFAAQE